MKNQWKKGLSVILCIALMLSCNAQVFALTIDYSDGKANIITDREQQELNARVKDVIQKIDEIGKVEFTDFCLSKIVKAENAFNRLTDELKDQVTNYSTLRYAREAYEALKAGNQSTSSFTVKDSGTIENVVWTFYTNGLLEISGEGAVPSYDKYNSAPWNNYLSSITSILVRDTISSIGASAFGGCNKLSEITLPFVGKSHSAIGYESAFGYIFDYKAENSTGGADATGYSVGDIYKCDEYSSRISYVTYVNEGRIGYSCDYIYSVPSSIKTVNITDASKIGAGAFAKCTYITKIVLNDGITSIGDFAFQNNPWYKSLTDEFVIDGDNVLIKYNGTKSNVVIPDTVKHIAGGVFKNNTKISAVTLPDELLSIGENTFNGCTNLTAMTIPKSVVKIGGNAIPDACTISVYRPSAGYDYRSTNRIVLNSSFTTGNETYYHIVNDDGCAEIIGCTTTSTELTVPTDFDGIVVNKIGDYGFANCTTLNSITIPANILNIGKYAFTGGCARHGKICRFVCVL